MLYELLRVSAQFALRWYYSELIVQGRENIPVDQPVLVVANHPNALVDALIVGTTIRRRVLITARATLFESRALASVLRRIGVVPLLRVQDVPVNAGTPGFLGRNDASLERVTDALRQGEVVLIFPEGISHDRPSMAPLKSGAARIALQAREKGAQRLCVLPVGLIYEAKEHPRTRVLTKIGAPIHVDDWYAVNSAQGAPALTEEIALALRSVTLNFATEDRGARGIRLARALTMLRDGGTSVARDGRLDDEVLAAHRIERATEALERSPVTLQLQADELMAQLQDLEMRLARRGIALRDALVSSDLRPGFRFALRETALACVLLPLALLGRASHWVPLRIARGFAVHSVRSDPSRDQPAMRTILIGLIAVPIWYAIQGAVITSIVGGWQAVIWLSISFMGANADARYRGRLERAFRRARAYFVYRSDPLFQATVVAEGRELLRQATTLEAALLQSEGMS